MNVLFHSITAIGMAVMLTDTSKPIEKSVVRHCCLVFIVGVFFHGILDYMPHCYPIPSKTDAILSLALIIITIIFTNRKYKLIVAASFLGNIFPDLIDLSCGILNKCLHFNLPVHSKIFPWHWVQYSGSIYNGNCSVSNLNHIMIITFVIIVCVVRNDDFKRIFLSIKK